MIWNAAGQIDRTNDGDSMLNNRFAGAGELAISTTLGSKINNHRARSHLLDHVVGNQHRRLLARDHRCRDDHVTLFDDATQELALPRVEGFVLRGSVPASIL